MAAAARWRRGDTVFIGDFDPSLVGIVLRASSIWADLLWIQANERGLTRWRKRQPDASLLKPARSEHQALASMFLFLQAPL